MTSPGIRWRIIWFSIRHYRGHVWRVGLLLFLTITLGLFAGCGPDASDSEELRLVQPISSDLPSATLTATPRPTETAAPTLTETQRPIETSTPTHTATAEPTATPQPTSTQTPTDTPTITPTATASATATLTPLPTAIVACPDGCTASSPVCQIKGNISSSGEKIYHMPGGAFYEQTIISPEKGERWFCTEEEAQAAGWRRSKR